MLSNFCVPLSYFEVSSKILEEDVRYSYAEKLTFNSGRFIGQPGAGFGISFYAGEYGRNGGTTPFLSKGLATPFLCRIDIRVEYRTCLRFHVVFNP